MDDCTGDGEPPDDGSLRTLRQQLVRQAEGRLSDSMRQQLSDPKEQLLHPLIFDEVDVRQIVGEEGVKLSAGAGMDDEVGVYAARTKQAKVVIRNDRLAAKTSGCIFSNDQDALELAAQLAFAPNTR